MKKILFLLSTLLFSVSNLQAAPVNINQADADEIASALKGIGIKKAEAIVRYRDQHGNFEHVEDLGNVKGIGDTLLSTLGEDILIDTP